MFVYEIWHEGEIECAYFSEKQAQFDFNEYLKCGICELKKVEIDSSSFVKAIKKKVNCVSFEAEEKMIENIFTDMWDYLSEEQKEKFFSETLPKREVWLLLDDVINMKKHKED